MAPVSDVLRTSSYYLLFLLVLHAADSVRGDILSVGGAECFNDRCRYVVEVPRGSSWRLTPTPGVLGGSCGSFLQEYEIRELADSTATSEASSRIEVTVPEDSSRLFFCRHVETQRPLSGIWIHQGPEVFIQPRTYQGLNDIGGQVRLESRAADGDDISRNATSLDRQGETQAAEALDAQPAAIQQHTDAAETNTLDDNNLVDKDTWVDLSHDIDVNNEQGAPRLTREEADDILVLNAQTDQYVPLGEVNSEFRNVDDVENFVDDEIAVKLPAVNANFRQIRELGANIRDTDYISQENTVVDLIETIDPKDVRLIEEPIELREKRQITDGIEDSTTEQPDITPAALHSSKRREDDFTSVRRAEQPEMVSRTTESQLRIEGIRIEKSTKPPEVEEGIPSVVSFKNVTIRVFGVGLTEDTVISFTHDAADYGSKCNHLLKGEYFVTKGSVASDGTTALFEFVAPEPVSNNTFYICAINAKPSDSSEYTQFVHQGSAQWVTLMIHNKPLPLWATLCLILVCLMFSALFSGLNLGLMSLDRTELKIIANTGTEIERRYARAIQPVRDHGNYLLCSILLGNVAVNSTFTILLDDLMSGLFAVIFSTLAIVCLGEIVPQAICSRHGLMIGAKSIVVTKAVMGITAPLAYPVSKLLDYFLGEEIGNVYNRDRLKELVKVTNDINDLDKDEVNIISGALEMRKKTVTEVMTKIEDVFMLSSDSVLDFETMSEIVKSGYSRIPVYEGGRNNIVTVLFIKDLAFVDPDDNTPLRTLCQFYQNACNFVFEDTTLDVMFRQFKEGHKGHMAFVHRVNNEGEGDPFYETIGLVTLEDVIEEMIQAEIVDETDVFMDNRSKRRRHKPINKLQDFAAFAERRENQRIRISPQLTLATFQFLSSSVDAFRPDVVSETVLRRLLRQDIIHQIKCKGKDKRDPSTLVYTQGRPVDYFVLILEGRVEVTVGRENLVFEAGPFTYFGVQALTQNVGIAESPTPSAMGSLQNINMDAMLRYTFVPDYSVRAITELFYIIIKRSLYLAAKRATLMEKTSSLTKGGASAGEQFDNEVDKLLQSLDEDGSIGGDHRSPSRQISPGLPPASASHQTRSSFTSPAAPAAAPNNGDVTYKFPPSQQIETEEK